MPQFISKNLNVDKFFGDSLYHLLYFYEYLSFQLSLFNVQKIPTDDLLFIFFVLIFLFLFQNAIHNLTTRNYIYLQ
ncbi:hypothetical protein BGV40_08915 [Methanosarcina sp. Ant1]|nr:hypothetical protein BGV40_08915 [Methanosarcina sp. Ant1]